MVRAHVACFDRTFNAMVGVCFGMVVLPTPSVRSLQVRSCMATPLTANDRFKRRHRRIRWPAIGIAVLVHAGILLLMPSFNVDFGKIGAAGPRMAVTVGDWRPPLCVPECEPAFAAFDTTWVQPELKNIDDLNLKIPRLYPPLLWRYREPSYGLFEITVNRSGRVRRVVLLESSDNGGEDALMRLVGMMRYEPDQYSGSQVAVMATVELEIDRPR